MSDAVTMTMILEEMKGKSCCYINANNFLTQDITVSLDRARPVQNNKMMTNAD